MKSKSPQKSPERSQQRPDSDNLHDPLPPRYHVKFCTKLLSGHPLARYPNNPSFKVELARSIISQYEFRYGYREVISFLSLDERTRLLEAIKLLTIVLRNKELELPDSKRSNILNIRALAKSMLGQKSESLLDWDEAAALSTAVENHFPYAVRLYEADRIDDAISFLTSSNVQLDEISLASLYANILLDRSKGDDLQVAKTTLLNALDEDLANDSVINVLGLITLADLLSKDRLSQIADFEEYYAKFKQRLTTFSQYIVLTRMHFAFNEIDEANIHASMAILTVSTCEDDREKRQLAIEMNFLGRKAECANLLADYLRTNRSRDMTILMLDNAVKVGLDSLVLNYTGELRSNKIYDEEIIRNEATLLAKYGAVDDLRNLLNLALKQNFSSDLVKWIRFSIAIVAIDTGMLDLIETDSNLLPAASQIHMSELNEFTKVMRFGPGSKVAVEQLYDLIRKNRNAVEPKQAFFASMHLHDDYEDDTSLETVSVGTAVLVKTESNENKWYVIEDGEDPDPFHSEYSPNQPVSTALLGRRVGENVIISRGIETSKYLIEKILDKYQYLCSKILETFTDTHPESDFLLKFTIRNNSDGKPDFRILGVQLNYLEQKKKDLIAYYQEKHLPLSALAMVLGRSLASAWWHVVSDKYLSFLVIEGNTEEFVEASKKLNSGDTLVLDSSAAITLLYTGLWKHLPMSEIKIAVPTAVLNDIWCLVADSHYRSGRGGTLHVSGDVPYIKETDIESWGKHQWKTGMFLQWLRKKCEIVDVISLSRLSPQKRKLISCVGNGSAAAIAVVAEQGWVLWTDDLAVSNVGKMFRVNSRVWTLAIADHFMQKNYLSVEVFQDFYCDLIAYGYTHFPINADLLMRAGARSNWDPRLFPFNGMCYWFANENLITGLICSVLRESTAELHKKISLDHQELEILTEIFKAISTRKDRRIIANYMSQIINEIYPIEFIHQERVVAMLNRWCDLSSR
ncbi:transcription elongation factor GreA [Gimesia maris]|uniref:PIN domain-containing protein n=1 Tax=Gimesia maris TaxID=122 RepID=UPI0011890C44|nr:GreA/GreB family elongation factor [Gimesia maris]QDU14533.1 transcription elongation factor GreA [Gimesia maris]